MGHVLFTAAVLDLFHSGHKELLKQMRDYEGGGNKVVVFLHDDLSTYVNKDKFPVQDYKHREKNLYATGLVDVIVRVNSCSPAKQFEKFITYYRTRGRLDELVYMRGGDWRNFPGKEVVVKYRIPIVYKKYTEGISSTKLRDEISK